jgi:hypothetical protein
MVLGCQHECQQQPFCARPIRQSVDRFCQPLGRLRSGLSQGIVSYGLLILSHNSEGVNTLKGLHLCFM